MKRKSRVSLSEKPAKFNTAYPTQEEIKWYLKQDLIDELDIRLCAKTIKNKLIDIAAAEPKKPGYRTYPFDILKKVYVHVDILTILKEACKSSVMQRLIYDDDFWKQKFLCDFPEVTALKGTELPVLPVGFIYPKGLEKRFAENPWRRYYNVTRYFISSIRKLLPSILGDVDKRNLTLSFRYESICDVNMNIAEKSSEKVHAKFITFYRYLEHFGLDIRYLKTLTDEQRTKICAAFSRHDRQLEHFFGWVLGGASRNFYDAFERGFYKSSVNGHIYIG